MKTTSQPILAFSGFSFKYNAQKDATLHDITLKIYPGEKILIVGPSGSGKSTLGNCINGLVPNAFPGTISGLFETGGETAEGKSIFDLSVLTGTVLQDPDGQFVALNAGEDVAFALENECVPQVEMIPRVYDLARLVEMEQHLEKSPQDLSGGQKQRITMAGVLTNDAPILLFDEPLANLDPATGKQAMELIHDLHLKTGKTVIIIEHRLEDVLHRPVDRIVVLENGKITADMPPAELLSRTILTGAGIREPLYLAALRYAGESFTPEKHPQQVETVAFSPEKLASWDAEQEREKTQKTGKPLLQIENLSFSWDPDGTNPPVLKEVTLTLHAGERVSLVGKNGAGKSTLAKLVCGFEHPLSGSMIFDGEDLARLSIKERAGKIGYVMQNPNQMISHPMLFDEVSFGLRTRGVPAPEIEKRVHDTLKICGLFPFRNWPISALSFGQKKRVTIASILVLGPELIILDEPTAGQDFRHYTEIMDFLESLNTNTGASLLMITHDMHLMLEYTTRAIVISDGTLVANDTPANILTNDSIIEKASLKRTSLYDLALRSGIPHPGDFVQRFIEFDRRERRR